MGAFLPHAFPRANRNARALLGGMQRLLGGRQRRFLGKEVTWLRAALPSEPPPLFSCFSSPALLSCQREGAASCRSEQGELRFKTALAEI